MSANEQSVEHHELLAISHDAAENIQRHVRGVQARAKTPPVLLGAQASAELSVNLDHSEKEGIHHDQVVAMYATSPSKEEEMEDTSSSRNSNIKTSPAASRRKKKQSPTEPRYKTNKAACIAIQRTMRGCISKEIVRIKRGENMWANTPLPERPTHGWIKTRDLTRKRFYYYHHERAEYRWNQPSPLMFEPVHDLHNALSGLLTRVELAGNTKLYSMHGPAYDAIEHARASCKSALNKCKALFSQENTCRDLVVDDSEAVEAGIEMLEDAHATSTDVVEDDLMTTLIDAQSDILEGMMESCERVQQDLERHTRSGLLASLGTRPGDPNVRAMLLECRRSVGHVVGWWDKTMEDVPEDTRAYLQLEGWNGRSRSDWYPLHSAVEACDVNCKLLKDCLAQAVETAQRAGEVKRESKELETMRLEEISQRTLERKKRARAEEWAKKETELTQLRAAWRYGMHLRDKEKKENERNQLNLQKAKEQEKILRMEERRKWLESESGGGGGGGGGGGSGSGSGSGGGRSNSKSHLAQYNNSPWCGVERGCSRYELEELIAEERGRRQHQEKRKKSFHVDDPEHDTGKILLHQACFWGHSSLVEYLLARGANPNKMDSCVTRFTPLDEACRGGSPTVVSLLLDACGREGIYVRNIHGDTPIHTAARGGRSQHLSVMVERCKGRDRGPDGGGTVEGAEEVFRLIDCTNGKKKTPLQLTTNDGVKELLLSASEWAIDARANQGVFGMSKKKRRGGRGGSGSGSTNTMGKWLSQMNPSAY